MPFLTPGDTSFDTLVSRGRLHRKSDRLNRLIEALVAFQQNATQPKLSYLYKRLYRWIEENPSEYNHRNGQQAASQLLDEIITRVRTSNWQLQGHSPADAASLLSGIHGTLQAWKSYACADVGTFAGDINQALSAVKRNAIYTLGTSTGQATGLPNIPLQGVVMGDWDATKLNTSHNRVTSAHSGECTSFGFAAAHLMGTAANQGMRPRIEVVAYKINVQQPRTAYNRTTGRREPVYKRDASGALTTVQAVTRKQVTHVFCIVGRRNLDRAANGQLPPPATWGNPWIVDPWLGSLGYNSIFRQSNYPKQGYLQPVFIEMDSYQNGPAFS